MITDEFQGASDKQIDDLLSGDRPRVKAAVDQLPRHELVAALSTASSTDRCWCVTASSGPTPTPSNGT